MPQLVPFIPDTSQTLCFDAAVILSVIIFIAHCASDVIVNTDVSFVADAVNVTDTVNIASTVQDATVSMMDNESMSDYLIRSAQSALNTIYLFIEHGAEQSFRLATLSIDGTMNTHATASVTDITTVTELSSINEQFTNAVNSIVSGSTALMTIQLEIITKIQEDFFVTTPPFIPLQEFFVTNPVTLIIKTNQPSTILLDTPNIANNLPILYDFINTLALTCDGLCILTTQAANADLADITWFRMVALHQLIRYCEVIHSVYSPIIPIDNRVSNLLEEE